MKYLLFTVLMFAAVGQVAANTSGLAATESAVKKHYKQAVALRDQSDFAAAIEEVAKGIALNPVDRDLYAQCELLSTELYIELGMLDSAATTARQIQMIYAETVYEKQAAALSKKIEQLREQSGTLE